MNPIYPVNIQKTETSSQDIPVTRFSILEYRIRGFALQLLIEDCNQGDPGIQALFKAKNNKIYLVGGKKSEQPAPTEAGVYHLPRSRKVWISIDLSSPSYVGKWNVFIMKSEWVSGPENTLLRAKEKQRLFIDIPFITTKAKLQETPKDAFWKWIRQEKSLIIINDDGSTVTYTEKFFQRLLQTKPDFSDLTEMYTLRFANGDEVRETKARILMCGDYFRLIKYVDKSTFSLSFEKLTKNSFEELLKCIENIEDPENLSEELKAVADFVGFHPTTQLEGRRPSDRLQKILREAH